MSLGRNKTPHVQPLGYPSWGGGGGGDGYSAAIRCPSEQRSASYSLLSPQIHVRSLLHNQETRILYTIYPLFVKRVLTLFSVHHGDTPYHPNKKNRRVPSKENSHTHAALFLSTFPQEDENQLFRYDHSQMLCAESIGLPRGIQTPSFD